MDLAGGHVLCLEQIDRDDIFKKQTSFGPSAFGGSGGKYRAYNVSERPMLLPCCMTLSKIVVVPTRYSSERARACRS